MLVVYTGRRFVLALVLSLGVGQLTDMARAAAPPSAPATAAFSFDALRQRAAASSAGDYRPEPNRLPEALKKLTYVNYQQIRFRSEASPWKSENLPFTLQFFHPGFLYQEPVYIHLVEGGRVVDFPFSPAAFDYGGVQLPKPLPSDLFFVGLRILYPVNSPTKQDEVASFLGASYFRILGQGQRYGASARALAIDTAEPTGEEFPRFTEFWIEKPAPQADSIRFYGLLNSPSATGAYQFTLKPGNVTVLDVDGYVYLRKDVRKLGFGALTSMYLVGANRTRFIPDFRPEVHDSDGLLVQSSTDDWQWRPLVNPEKTYRISRIPGDNLKGFGLLQRHRQFSQYEDLVARYEVRPNLWISPRQPLGPGTVELVEIPTPNEYNDNIVAYWVPKEKAVAAQRFHLAYTVSASLEGPPGPPRLRVQSTLLDPPHDKKPPRFLIDFIEPKSAPVAAGGPVAAKVTASRGRIQNLAVQTNDVTGGWRVFFDLDAPGDEKVELRAVLGAGETVLSEAWIYHWLP